MADQAFSDRGSDQRAFRFAPSPNGMLHLGHAYSALMNERLAGKVSGHLLLRLENIDLARCSHAFELAIMDDLAWLGIQWRLPIWRQSDRFGDYRAALDRLDRMGLVYPCFCTRGEILKAIEDIEHWPRDPDGSPLYPGTCRRRCREERTRLFAQGAVAGLRLDMTLALDMLRQPLGWTEYRQTGTPERIKAEPARWGDALLARKDIPTSYHVSVVVDDAAQGITDVVRGEDLLQATGLHRLLQSLLACPNPPTTITFCFSIKPAINCRKAAMRRRFGRCAKLARAPTTFGNSSASGASRDPGA